MNAIIIKFFTTMIAMMIAHRVITTIFTLVIFFLIYKYFTDPKSFGDILKTLKEILGGIGGGAELPEVESIKKII